MCTVNYMTRRPPEELLTCGSAKAETLHLWRINAVLLSGNLRHSILLCNNSSGSELGSLKCCSQILQLTRARLCRHLRRPGTFAVRNIFEFKAQLKELSTTNTDLANLVLDAMGEIVRYYANLLV